MIAEIVYPTLDEYATRVHFLAEKYGVDDWMNLNADVMDSDEKFEFSFIKECLWSNLIHREFELYSESPGQNKTDLMQDKPGANPGLSFWQEVLIEGPRVRRPN